jgi:hypothetical protein
MILEHEPRKIAINPDRFDKLITALRTAAWDSENNFGRHDSKYLY